MQAGNHTNLQYSIVSVKSIPVLSSFRLLTLFASTTLPEGGFGSAESFSSSPEAPSQRELSPEVTEGVSLHQRAQQPQHTVQHRAGQAGAAFRHLYLAALRQRGPYIVPQNCHLTVLLQQYTALKV